MNKKFSRAHVHPYSFIRLQKLPETGYPRRIIFGEELLVKIQKDRIFMVFFGIWTHGAKFTRQELFYGRNRHSWVAVNPHLIYEVKNQIQFSVSVFCLLMDNRLYYLLAHV